MNKTLFTLALSLCNIQCRRFFFSSRQLINQFQLSSVVINNKMGDKNNVEKKDSDTEKDSRMDNIRSFFEKLNFFDRGLEDGEMILDEASLDGVARYIKSHNIKNIITMAGAGISTSAGIPDFRSPKSGLYHNLEKYKLPHPQAIFEMDFFRVNPEPFFALAKELLPEGYKPTPSHYFLKLLHDKGLLLRHYTQNIDTLERIAGLPEEKIVEAHGTFFTGHCLECHEEYDLDWMKEKIKEETVPKCEKCVDAVVKPDIVFFGEMLPDRFHLLMEEDFPKAELLIIMGSSLVVQPFASLIDKVEPNCPRLLINMEKVGVKDRLTRLFCPGGGFNYDCPHRRDVAWLGECDKGVELLADKLGWKDELKELISKEHERLEKEFESKAIGSLEKKFANSSIAASKKDDPETEKASKI